MAQYTPMIEQYLKVKEQAQDAFLFFRLGDFYEMFFEDATLAAKELEITLTGREGGSGERIPMCGVPYHSADNYIQRLIEKGYKVAVCEQMEDPAATKGMVRREIVRVITPGTVMEGKTIGEKSNNYMICLTQTSGVLAIAACDLSTGELYVTSAPYSEKWLKDEIGIYEPSELIGDAELLQTVQSEMLAGNRKITYTACDKSKAELVITQFGEAAWARLGEERRHCLATLFAYLNETQKRSLGQLTQIQTYEPDHYMILDPFTRRNLELVETVRDRSKKGSLLSLIDKTETSMGARMLRRWIDKPLLQRQKIEERVEAVDKLYNQFILRSDIREQLKEIYDLERLVGRIAFGNANGRDLNALKVSLEMIPALAKLCADSPSSTLRRIAETMDDCSDLREMIHHAIVDEPPVSVREGGMIREGYHEHLDELRYASVNGKRWIAELEAQEREITGIRSLKIGYNKVFGYYIEVTKSNISSLPEGRYERKQTLANAERYITPELKEKESLILEAEDKMVGLEYSLFIEIRDQLSKEIKRLQKLAEQVAEIDVYHSLAAVSAERGFVKPCITDGFDMKLIGGRHPVVESVMRDGAFMANDTVLTQEDPRILLITGPNMAGKSTYMRQVALISILAQIGCFVPAVEAEVPIMDRIFTRIGAGDDLIGGQSTFMVEMADIQVMTEKATPRSLIIIDELGRGTSTSEGMAIAQSVIEYVHDHIGCKALVSTHFHELAHLEDSLPSLRNYSMAVQEKENEVQFLRKLIPGAASSSYGIYVARLAGLPSSIIDRASRLIHTIEEHSFDIVAEGHKEPFQNDYRQAEKEAAASSDQMMLKETKLAAKTFANEETEEPAAMSNEVVQLSIFGDEWPEPKKKGAQEAHELDPVVKQLIKRIRNADLMNMTPLQAMQLVNELKMKVTDM